MQLILKRGLSRLFQAICSRYERNQAIVLTSNKASVIGVPFFRAMQLWQLPLLIACFIAVPVINIRGESYRLKEKRNAGCVETPKEEKTTKKINKQESD